MSTDLPPGAARAFYGSPQHETRTPGDPERARVVSDSEFPSDRDLLSYAERSSSVWSGDDRSRAERRRVYVESMRRRVVRARSDDDAPRPRPSDAGVRGVMVRW